MSVSVKIAVAEPSALLRGGLVAMLRSLSGTHVEPIEIENLEQLRHVIGWQHPDILVINPSSLGYLSLPQIRKESGSDQLRCVALQVSMVDSTMLREYDEVISLYDSAELIHEKLQRLIRQPEPAKRAETLSGREKEVVARVIQGLTNKQIAEELHLSAHTVITHRRNIAAKLQIHSTAGLTIYAIVNKLVEIDNLQDSVSPAEKTDEK